MTQVPRQRWKRLVAMVRDTSSSVVQCSPQRPQPQTQPSLRPPPVFGDPEEKDYYHLLLLPALPDILQFTLSTSYPLSGSLPLSLRFKELKSEPVIYTSLTQTNSVAYRWWMQLSPPLAEMLAVSLNFVWKKETMAILFPPWPLIFMKCLPFLSWTLEGGANMFSIQTLTLALTLQLCLPGPSDSSGAAGLFFNTYLMRQSCSYSNSHYHLQESARIHTRTAVMTCQPSQGSF